MAAKREIVVPSKSVRRVCIGLAGFDAGGDAPHLGLELLRHWNPQLAAKISIRPDDIRVVEGQTIEGIIAELKSLSDQMPDCSLIIQHGGFSLMKKSAGVAENVPVVLGIFYERPDGAANVEVGAGLDMTVVPATRVSATAAVSHPLLTGVPAVDREKLVRVENGLSSMAITAAAGAEEELERHNTSRRTVWGNQAAVIPIARGSANDVLGAVYACIANDFSMRGAKSLAVEQSEDVLIAPETQSALDHVAPALRHEYASRLAKHKRKESGQPAPVRKYGISVYFPQSFGKHEILRIGENEYLAMPCTLDTAVPPVGTSPTRPRLLGIPEHGKRKPVNRALLGCLGVVALGGVMATIGMLTGEKETRSVADFSAHVTPVSIDVGNRVGRVAAAKVDPAAFEQPGVSLVAGRQFGRDEYAEPARAVVVISEDFATQLYRPTPIEAIGRELQVDGRNMTIVGIVRVPAHAVPDASVWLPRTPRG